MVDTLFEKGIFIIHALKGYEFHEARINSLFRKNELNFEFVTDGDPVHFNEEVLGNYFSSDIKRVLSKGVLSCTLNHIHAYERVVARGLEYAIIFENDPFFLGNFKNNIKKYYEEINNLPKGFIISLENSTLRFPSFWQAKRGKYLYQAKSGRMAGAYIIDLEGAKKILSDLQIHKCDTVIDWWHNSLIERSIINMYWAHPAIVEQGSHNGYLNATISSKPDTMIRRNSWLAQKFYKYYFRRLFKQKTLSERQEYQHHTEHNKYSITRILFRHNL